MKRLHIPSPVDSNSTAFFSDSDIDFHKSLRSILGAMEESEALINS